MGDFIIKDKILIKYTGTDSEVVIPDDVVEIGGGAFFKCEKIKKLILPDGLEKIAGSKYGFRVKIDGAFQECSNLEQIIIPDSVTKIGKEAFLDCKKLKIVKLSNRLTTIEASVFEGCSNLEQIVIPDGVTEIKAHAFTKCGKLKVVEFSNNLKAIGARAFRGCRNLEEITLPESLARINTGAFEGCHLNSVVIPANVSDIGADAFKYCTRLETIELPDGLKNIGNGAFNHCIRLETIELPDSLESIEHGAFLHCDKLDTIKYSSEKIFDLLWKGLEKKQKINFLVNLIRENKKSPAIIRKVKANRVDLLDIAFKNDVVEIIAYICSLYDRTPIEELDTYIEKAEEAPMIRAFLLNYKTENYSVNDLDKLENDKLEKELGIKERTLADWKKIYTLVKEDGKNYAITKYKGNEPNIIVPNQIGKTRVIAIGERAFSPTAKRLTEEERIFRKTKIETITLSDGLQEIGHYAFEECENLKSIEFPEGMTRIGMSAFLGCTGLEMIKIPNSVKKIGGLAFYRCDNLVSIILPEQIKRIEGCTFKYCKNLKSVVVPKNVTSIEEHAFEKCESLVSIHISANVTEIAKNAFEGCTNLTIYSTSKSYAQQYAGDNNIPFVEE